MIEIKSEDQAQIEAAAKQACYSYDLTAHPYVTDTFKSTVAWRDSHPSTAVKGLVEALREIRNNPCDTQTEMACSLIAADALIEYEESLK